MRQHKWTVTQLKRSVKQARSYRQVLILLNLREAGGNYTQIKKYVEEYKLDISHFTGRAWNKGLKGIGKFRIPLDKILIKNSTFQSYKLKTRLIREGLKPSYCERCGWNQCASDGRLPLELHHINGDSHDNRLENLIILCPNCHSLQPNYRGRKVLK